MAPFEALYGRRCQTPLSWSQPGEYKVFGPDLVTEAEEKVKVIQTNLKTEKLCRQKKRTFTVQGRGFRISVSISY